MTFTPTNSERGAPGPIFMTADNVARDYCIPKATLAKWRWNSTGPDYAKLGAKVLYRKADIDRWIADNTRTSAASNDNEVTK